MKTKIAVNGILGWVVSLGMIINTVSIRIDRQNALQFTSVNATPERAIQLHWASFDSIPMKFIK